MARLVFSGLFDRHADLKLITHHMGAMRPDFEGRAGGGLDQLGSRTEEPQDGAALARLARRPLDYFKMFYGDTTLFGACQAIECGLAFFGAERILFGTDMPLDPETGPGSSGIRSGRSSSYGRQGPTKARFTRAMHVGY
jgi:predicted TIM-barrel fold metal-dependent hydrolase